MDKFHFRLHEHLNKSEYFQRCLESLLTVLQPSFYCVDLIVKVLLAGPDGSGKRTLAKSAAESLNMKFIEIRAADLFDENIVGTEKKVRTNLTKAASSAPCLIYLTNYDLLCKLEDPDLDRIEHCIRETLEELIQKENSQPIVFIGASNDFDQVYNSPISDIFQHNIIIKSPSLDQAQEIVNLIISGAELQSKPIEVLKTDLSKGQYYLGNLMNLIAKSEIESCQDSETSDLDTNQLSQIHQEGVRWEDVGGLNEVKQDIIDAIQMTIDFPQLKKSGLRRTGVLLYGPPGTGKTLLAKAVASECDLNFINVKGPELLNEYVGQSEDNIRKLFQKARDSSPSVIFFDEIDSLAPNRGQAGDSGGVMDRMVSQILAEMDGVGRSDGVFVIGATNRVDLVDPSLLRPGRFDKVLEVPLPTSRESRIQILKALTRRMNLDRDVDLLKIESMAQVNMSGADFQSLCSKALHKTFNRCVEQVESGQTSEDDIIIVTTMKDFVESLGEA